MVSGSKMFCSPLALSLQLSGIRYSLPLQLSIRLSDFTLCSLFEELRRHKVVCLLVKEFTQLYSNFVACLALEPINDDRKSAEYAVPDNWRKKEPNVRFGNLLPGTDGERGFFCESELCCSRARCGAFPTCVGHSVSLWDASFSHLPFKRLIDDKWTKISVEERDKRSQNWTSLFITESRGRYALSQTWTALREDVFICLRTYPSQGAQHCIESACPTLRPPPRHGTPINPKSVRY